MGEMHACSVPRDGENRITNGCGRRSAVALTCALAFLVSLISCEALRVLASKKALLDRPNERSLHTLPTPRLGGLGLVGATLLVVLPLAMHAHSETRALLGASAGVACLGLVDDFRPLPASLRLLVQLAASAAFLWLVGVPKALLFSNVSIELPPIVIGALLTIWMTGVLNIYNFMDGMDGLAGSQAVTAGAGTAVLMAAGAPELTLVSAVLAASSGGFLMHNFPPARIFMGDAGSTFVGFALAALVVLGMHHGVPFAVTALLLTPFLLDGTFTIVRRALRREAIWRAHRSHLYQRAVQTGLGHRDVLLVYAAWMAMTFAGGMWNPIAGWAASLGAFVWVWRWVLSRESKKMGLA